MTAMQQKQYWVTSDGHELGPLSEEVVRSLLGAGKIRSGDYAWHAGLPEWRRLGEILPPPVNDSNEQRPPPLIVRKADNPVTEVQKAEQENESNSYGWLWFFIGVAGVGFRVWVRGSMEHGALAPFAGLIIVGCLVWLIHACSGSK